MSCCGGSGGSTGETQYNWNPTMTNYWGGNSDFPGGLLLRGLNNSIGRNYSPYGDRTTIGYDYAGNAIQGRTGQRIADENWTQQTARQYSSNLLGDGTELGRAGRDQALDTVQGQYLNSNPYSQMVNDPRGYNTQQATVGANEYMGPSGQFDSIVNRGMGKIADAYARGTAADTAKMFAQSRAFGGSAHQEAMANNQAQLAENLGNYANQMYDQQWNRSANLREADLGRQSQTSQFNVGLADRNVDRFNQRLSGSADAWNNERNRMVGLTPAAMGNDQNALDLYKGIYGMGQTGQAQQQRYLDQQYGDWQTGQDWNWNQIQRMANLLSQAQGGVGGQVNVYGQSPNGWAQALGAGLMGYGMFRS